jgi:hypothetical protein
MSDEALDKKTRAPINALKIINALRAEKGLPKVGAKPVQVKLTKVQKEDLFKQVVKELFPESLTEASYEFTDRNAKTALAEFEKRVKELQGEVAPKAPYNGKPRGRKPKSV